MTFMIDEPKILAWKDLQFTKEFCDVTLACDGKQIEAHMAVLSSTSHLFRNILKHNSTKFPLINLVGMQYSELANMLDFMYQGQVNIDQDDLNSFLAIAEDFKIKGIFEGSKSSYNYVNLQLRYPYSNNSSKSKPMTNLLHKENKSDNNVDTFQNMAVIDQLEDNINLEINEDTLGQNPKKKINCETFNNKDDIVFNERKTDGLFPAKNKYNYSENNYLPFAKDKKYGNEFNDVDGIDRQIQNNFNLKNNSKQLIENGGTKQIRLQTSSVHQEFTRHRVKMFRKRWGKERLITISKCNHCNKEYIGKYPSRLKSHLEEYHSQSYEEVIKKDLLAFNKVNRMQGFERETAKRIRVKASSVHQEFTRQYVKTFNKRWGKERLSTVSKCNHCKREYIGKNPTTLKVHLEVQHYQIYKEVTKKDVNAREMQKICLENSFHKEDTHSENGDNSESFAFIDQLEDTDIISKHRSNDIFNKDLKREMYKGEVFNKEYVKEREIKDSLIIKIKEKLSKNNDPFYDENLKDYLINKEDVIELEMNKEATLSTTNKEPILVGVFDLKDSNMDNKLNEDEVGTRVVGLVKDNEIISQNFTSKGAQTHFSQIENNSIAEDNFLEKFEKEETKQTRVRASAVHEEFTRRQVNSLKKSFGKEMFSTISKCNHCHREYQGKNPTTLKTHLEGQHNDVYDKVIRKDTETKQRQKLFWENRKSF